MKTLHISFVVMLLAVLAVAVSPASSQTPTTQQPIASYHERRHVYKPGGGTKEQDPNVYVYNAQFAERFLMPDEWMSEELKGVDAVAFRVVPSYPTCGWNGDPKTCRIDEARCEMDLYFDHQRNSLPWDKSTRPADNNYYKTSVWFLRSNVNQLARSQTTLLGGLPIPKEPLTNPSTTKELGWQYFTSLDQQSSWGWVGLLGYDKEIFEGVGLITLGVGCYSSPFAALVLASESVRAPFNPSDARIFKSVVFPQDWRSRVQEAMTEYKKRSEAFFKLQRERAIRELEKNPVPNVPIVPLN